MMGGLEAIIPEFFTKLKKIDLGKPMNNFLGTAYEPGEFFVVGDFFTIYDGYSLYQTAVNRDYIGMMNSALGMFAPFIHHLNYGNGDDFTRQHLIDYYGTNHGLNGLYNIPLYDTLFPYNKETNEK